MIETEWNRLKMNERENDKTKLKLQQKYTLSDNWNTYDPLGEVFLIDLNLDWIEFWVWSNMCIEKWNAENGWCNKCPSKLKK